MMKFRSGTGPAMWCSLRAPAVALCAGGIALYATAAATVVHAADEGLASAWVDGFNNKARLMAGRARGEDGGDAVFAGIEIVMPAGWKTYWKAPGEAGGIPPEFDFAQSDNLAAAEVLYPAPHRLLDKAGASIGYKDRVVFPVRLKAKDGSKAIALKLKAAYGVCRELCVPAEAEIALDVPATAAASAEINAALERVPRTAPLADRDPVLAAWNVEDRDGKPTLVLDVTDPGGPGGDLFAFGPGGQYMPLAKKTAETGGSARFALDLTDGVEIKDLKGKPIGITLVGKAGQTQTTIVLP